MADNRILTPDICVVGAGSGGLSVAAGAAAFGVEVVLVEKGEMGGDCLNHGCVPSKATIAAARHVAAFREATAFGIEAGAPKIDFSAVQRHVRSVIAAIQPNDSVARYEAMGVTVVRQAAHFEDARTVVAGEARIRARRFVLATGSAPSAPPIEGLDDVDYLTNETLFDLSEQPEHLIVIGGGPIGLEMAQAHCRLGARVTVLEAGRVLGREDPELAAFALATMRREGVTVLEHVEIDAVERLDGQGARVVFRQEGMEHSLEGSHLLVATGRTANVHGLGLDRAGIAHDRGGIVVGGNMKTTNRRVFAIGDAVSGGLQFTHAANQHAGLVLQQILFRAPAKERREYMPRVTFTDPELAHVGLTEAEARSRHRAIRVLRWPLAENDRAQAERRTEGLIKVIADRRGRILGTSIAAPGAGEMIHFWTLAITSAMRLSDIRGYVAPYPTMSEIGKRAAITYYVPMTRKPWLRRLLRFLRRFG